MAKGKTGLQIYRDSGLEWRWRAVAPNGRIVADCTEGYRRRADAIKGARAAGRILRSAPARQG